jgi:hypothetical protein
VASPREGKWEAGQVVHLHSLKDRKSACQVFDKMSARKQFLKFENFQVWVLIILDSDAKYIFVRSKGAILLKSYFDLGMSYE